MGVEHAGQAQCRIILENSFGQNAMPVDLLNPPARMNQSGCAPPSSVERSSRLASAGLFSDDRPALRLSLVA